MAFGIILGFRLTVINPPAGVATWWAHFDESQISPESMIDIGKSWQYESRISNLNDLYVLTYGWEGELVGVYGPFAGLQNSGAYVYDIVNNQLYEVDDTVKESPVSGADVFEIGTPVIIIN